MAKDLEKLIERGRRVRMTTGQALAQRESFAYGTAKIENDRVSKDGIREAARKLRQRRESA